MSMRILSPTQILSSRRFWQKNLTPPSRPGPLTKNFGHVIQTCNGGQQNYATAKFYSHITKRQKFFHNYDKNDTSEARVFVSKVGCRFSEIFKKSTHVI